MSRLTVMRQLLPHILSDLAGAQRGPAKVNGRDRGQPPSCLGMGAGLPLRGKRVFFGGSFPGTVRFSVTGIATSLFTRSQHFCSVHRPL
jgi:hypothetical protein